MKLAAKLLGWTIRISIESRHNELHAVGHGLEQLSCVAGIPKEQFLAAGLNTLARIREATDEELLAIEGFSPSKLDDVRAAVNFLTPGKEREEEEKSGEDAPAQAAQTQEEERDAE